MKIQLEPLRINHDPSDVYVLSDTHFGHDKPFIYEPRGFTNVRDHDAAVEKRWRETIKDTSYVFHLGDFIMGMEAEKRMENLLRSLPYSRLFVAPGNHFAGFKQLLEKYPRGIDFGHKRVTWIPNYFEIKVDGQEIILSHYPLHSWRGMGRGHWMLSGHCHGNCSYSHKNRDGKIMDVGIECIERPISISEIKKVMDKRKILTVDHH